MVKRFMPLIIVMGLFVLFLVRMQSGDNPKELDSVFIGRPAPEFELASLQEGKPPLTTADLKSGTPVLLNFFASWCVPCRAEHESLMVLAGQYRVPIYGIAYKDTPERSRAFLTELGNPFSKTGIDQNGRAAIDWGVTGVPETFLIDGDGIVRYRHWGPIVGDGLEARLVPELEKLR